MEVTSLYTNIPKSIWAYQRAYETVQSHPNNTTGTIAKATSSSSLEKNYLQMYGAQLMGTKMAVEFANIFVSKVETEILIRSDI